MSKKLEVIRVMLDLETLDVSPFSGIASIGACTFDHAGLGPRQDFYVPILLESLDLQKFGVSMSTLQWWMKQHDNAIKSTFTSPSCVRIETALDMFTNYIDLLTKGAGNQYPVEVWGNGCTFDNVILTNAYKVMGRKQPWRWSLDRDFRTLKSFATGDQITELSPKRGTHHNALDDAIWQSVVAEGILKLIGQDQEVT